MTKNLILGLVCSVVAGAQAVAGCDGPDVERSGLSTVDERASFAATGTRMGGTGALISSVRALLSAEGIERLEPAPEVRPELYTLGQALAFDKILSGNRNISCMTCHAPSLGSDDDRQLPIGEGGIGLGSDRDYGSGVAIARSAPPLFNLHVMGRLFWDGRVEVATDGTLSTPAGDQLTPEMQVVLEHGVVAAQALFPVVSRVEMRGQLGENELAAFDDDDYTGIWTALMARLGAIPEYVTLFEAAYPGTPFEDMSFAHAANAIGAFEVAAFDFADSPFDRFLTGDDMAMSDLALRGARAFLSTRNCVACHAGSALTDEEFHNTGLVQFGPGNGDGTSGQDDYGRMGVTWDSSDQYRFRTMPLRNVELSGPWGHAGQYLELEDFIKHYVNARRSLIQYDTSQIDPDLQYTLQDNKAQILANLDPLLRSAGATGDDGAPSSMRPFDLGAEKDVTLILEFLKALTDPAARDQSDLAPAAVPSGLPVGEG